MTNLTICRKISDFPISVLNVINKPLLAPPPEFHFIDFLVSLKNQFVFYLFSHFCFNAERGEISEKKFVFFNKFCLKSNRGNYILYIHQAAGVPGCVQKGGAEFRFASTAFSFFRTAGASCFGKKLNDGYMRRARRTYISKFFKEVNHGLHKTCDCGAEQCRRLVCGRMSGSKRVRV